MAYKPFKLEVEGKVVTLTTGQDKLARTFADENTAAQRFGDVRQTAIDTLRLLMD